MRVKEEAERGMEKTGTSSAHRRGLSSAHGMRVTKRAIAGRRAAPSTPVPSWRVFNNHLYDGMTRPPPASARKLAATLWELQDLPLPASLSACLPSPNWLMSSPPDSRSPHSQPVSPPASHRHVKVDRQRHVPCALFTSGGTRKGEVEGHTMSQELLKVFSQIRLLEEQHNSSLSLTSALHSELMAAHARVRELEAPQRNARREAEGLVRQEKAAWKAKEKERVERVQAELEQERAARQRLEGVNRRLAKELLESQAATAQALQELEGERKARELMEEVCQELAQETGDDKAEAEEMKRESLKMKEELEEERRMLQMAEVWREERVQMKLGEAKLALEEKSAALDIMKDELESFLRAQHHNPDGGNSSHLRDAQVLHDVLNAISSFPASEYHVHPDSESSSVHEELRHKHDSPTRAEPPLYYAEGIPDAD